MAMMGLMHVWLGQGQAGQLHGVALCNPRERTIARHDGAHARFRFGQRVFIPVVSFVLYKLDAPLPCRYAPAHLFMTNPHAPPILASRPPVGARYISDRTEQQTEGCPVSLQLPVPNSLVCSGLQYITETEPALPVSIP
jgi:hypothetical protein